jgi:hypothetical protein
MATAHISEDARALLRAAGDVVAASSPQAELSGEWIRLDMPAAGERAGMPVGSARYHDALWELEHESMIAQDPITRQITGGTAYILLGPGRAFLGL